MTPAVRIADYVLAKSPAEPTAVRIQLYTDLAALTPDDGRSASLLKLADELREIDRRCRQLRLDLGDDTAGNNGGAMS
jgi:CTP:molybdopterin cytidylyltransferase MocA